MDMPATSRGNGTDQYVLGVDGARAGWAIVRLSLATGALSLFVAKHLRDADASLFGHARAVHVDMPIGLARTGKRAAEAMTRAAIGPRRSSVFPAPRRPMLKFDTYEAANHWGKTADPAGGGLSKQAWNLIAKIRELDDLMTPDRQTLIVEAHPELIFTRLRGTPCSAPKKTPAGARERASALEDALTSGRDPAGGLINQARAEGWLKGDLADDDIRDACALAISARDRLNGEAWRMSDDACDGRGLIMEIWG